MEEWEIKSDLNLAGAIILLLLLSLSREIIEVLPEVEIAQRCPELPRRSRSLV